MEAWGWGRDSLGVGKVDNTLLYLAGSRELRELLAAQFYPDKYLTGLYQTEKVGTCALSPSSPLSPEGTGIMEWERWGFSTGERCEVACQVLDEAGPSCA